MNTIIIYSTSAPMFTMIGPLLSHSRNQLSKFEQDFDRDHTALFIKMRGEQMLKERGLYGQVGCNIRHFQIESNEELANSGVLFEFENEELTVTLEKLANALISNLDSFVAHSRETPIKIAPLQQQILFESEPPADKTFSENEYSELDVKTSFSSQDHCKKIAAVTNTAVESSEQHASVAQPPRNEEPFEVDLQILRELMAESKCNSLHLKDSLGANRGTFKTLESTTQTEPLKCNAWIIGIPALSPLKITIKFHIGKKSITTTLSVPVNSQGSFLTRLKSISTPENIECRATIEFDDEGEPAGLLDLEFRSITTDSKPPANPS